MLVDFDKDGIGFLVRRMRLVYRADLGFDFAGEGGGIGARLGLPLRRLRIVRSAMVGLALARVAFTNSFQVDCLRNLLEVAERRDATLSAEDGRDDFLGLHFNFHGESALSAVENALGLAWSVRGDRRYGRTGWTPRIRPQFYQENSLTPSFAATRVLALSKRANMKTFSAKASEVQRQWWIIDARDQVLGRVAEKAANLLRGKHKPIYTPHVDTGDFVVVINADKVRVTGKKDVQKSYMSFSGYVGGHHSETFKARRERHPELWSSAPCAG